MSKKTNIMDSYTTEELTAIKIMSLPFNDVKDEDLILYLYRCKELGLNPMSGEFIMLKKWSEYYQKYNYSFITTRDGYLKSAKNDPNYEGIDSGVYCEGDLLEFENGKVRHKFGTTRGKVIGGWAIVYKKGVVPKTEFAPFKEYYQANSNKSIWRQMPSAMIKKVAEVAALRIMFPLTGVYTFEEMNVETPRDINDSNTPFQQPINDNAISENKEVDKNKTESIKPNPMEISEENNTDLGSESYQTHPNEVPRMSYQLKSIKAGNSKQGTPYYVLTLSDDCNRKADMYALGDIMEKINELDLRENSRVHITITCQDNCFVINDIELAAVS
ncbi:RecT family recombinase [Chengkuizengella axinellae]|uniref:RecT family recombinase n=1 Tax=Chengkuizengella axinellae TaxID=3064388 RepID=A0ABT9J3S0_9BACL|nr:RecT family recombinase [Chengkuizengella sp. 2205SS18-9]MDP5276213.1 RecT family recombinase [Chengkuizengella sp. 2205SS18-9]